MAPIIIADSDDESETGGRFSPSKPQQPAPGTSTQAVTRSSDHGSLATASTDPVFFQKVFNEQNDAACEQARGSQGDLLKEDMHQSSAVTIPDVPFQRTTKGFYLSSITPITDPHTGNHDEASIEKMPNDWTQVTTHVGQKEVDPWDVPSSPEGPKLSGKLSRGRGSKVKGRTSGQTGHSATNGVITESSWDLHNDVDGRGSKRRRLAEPQTSPRLSNDISLVALPSSNGLGGDIETMAASSIPLPTLPIDSDSSFFIPPQISMDSQMPTNPGVNFACGGVGGYNNLLLQQQTLYTVGSSGTATNVNTPRGQMFSSRNFSSMAPEESDRGAAANTTACLPVDQRRNSSPDIISTMAPESDSKNSEHVPCNGVAPEVLAEPPPQELQSGDNDADLAPKETGVTKPKKRRGRPRKNQECDESQSTKPVDSLAPENEEPPITTQKKKRGRPKKHAPPVTAECAPPPGASAVEVNVDTMVKTNVDAPPKKDDDTHASKIDDRAGNPKGEEPVEERPFSMAENTRTRQEGRTSITEMEDMGLHDPLEKPNDADQCKSSKQPAAQGREEQEEGDKMKKGSSTPVAAKPLYRVGLSKRWKIAPLLKSVRKS